MNTTFIPTPRVVMRAVVWLAWLTSALVLAGCAIGPSTRVVTAVAPIVPTPEGHAAAVARATIDTLERERAVSTPSRTAPSPAGTALPAADRALVPASSASATVPLRVSASHDIAWLDVLRDTQLVSLVRDAVSNNLDLREAQSRVREYRAQLGVARAAQLPGISTTASTSRNRVALGPTVVPYDAVKVTGDLSWELDFWGRSRKQADAAAFELGARDAEVRSTVLSLVSDIATSYLRLRELDESVRISDQTLLSRRSTLELARRRFQQGVTSELDVFQFEADLADPAARVADFTRQRTQVENQLSQLLGRAPGNIPRGRALDEVVQALSVPDSLPGELIARRPDVVAAQRTLQASLSRVGVAAASRLPTISVTGQYGTQRPDFDRFFAKQNEIYTMQVGVTVPLFPFTRLRDEQRAAAARADQAQARYQQRVLTGLRESNDALAGVRLDRDQLTAQRTQVRALERAFALSDQRYRTGLSSYLEVLDAQRRLFAAQLAFVQTERQYLVSTVDLYKALGGGWDAGGR